MLGQLLTRPCTSRKGSAGSNDQDEATEPLLGEDRSRERRKPNLRRPSWREVFSPQSTIVLLAHATLSMHTMAFDSLLPVFLHSSEQETDGNPHVHLPFKFAGGFGIGKLETIGPNLTMLTNMEMQDPKRSGSFTPQSASSA